MAEPVGENQTTGRTKVYDCRCGVRKDEETFPGLLLCVVCDALLLSMVTAKDLPPEAPC